MSNSPPEDSSLTSHLCLALDNWKQITTDPWVFNAIQGYKTEFWTKPIQLCTPASLILSQNESYTVTKHIDPQAFKEENNLSCRPTSITRVPGPQKDDSLPTQSICHLGTLQDRKHLHSGALDPGGGLNVKDTVPLNYNFTFTSVDTSGATQVVLCRISHGNNFHETRRGISHGIYMTQDLLRMELSTLDLPRIDNPPENP